MRSYAIARLVEAPEQSEAIEDRATSSHTRPSWESSLRAGGYTTFPNALFRWYTRLGISESELVFLQQVWTYWWDDRLPYPAVGSIAVRMGKTVRQVQQYARALSLRGLVVVTRRTDASGRQLANGYDLRPLLSALAQYAAVEAAAACDTTFPAILGSHDTPTCPASPGSVKEVSAPRVKFLPPQGMKKISPEKHQTEELHKIDFVSNPVIPTTKLKSPVATDARSDTPALDDTLPIRQVIAELSSLLGDQAPRASGTRAAALYVESGQPLSRFLHAVKEAAVITRNRVAGINQRGNAGEVNATPYFFAVLEKLLRDPDAGKTMAHSPEGISRPSPDVTLLDAPPLWRAILNELSAVLPTRTFRERVAGTRVILEEESRLLIAVPSPFLREWLPRMLGRQLQEALAAIGRPDLRLEFVDSNGATGANS